MESLVINRRSHWNQLYLYVIGFNYFAQKWISRRVVVSLIGSRDGIIFWLACHFFAFCPQEKVVFVEGGKLKGKTCRQVISISTIDTWGDISLNKKRQRTDQEKLSLPAITVSVHKILVFAYESVFDLWVRKREEILWTEVIIKRH